MTRVRLSTAALAALVVTAAAAGAAVPPVAFRPPRAWVDALVPPEAPPAAEGESTGTRYLLFDQQILAGRGEEEDYFHEAWRVETTAGLQDASEIEVPYDPSFQTLVVHHARVVRGGRTVWSASGADVRVAHAEKDPEARLYDDALTATVFVRGLRVGDTVDYAYSLEGANPVLAGRLDDILWFDFTQPVDRVHRRIVWQRDAPLHLKAQGKAPSPKVASGAGGTVYSWDVRGARTAPSEDMTPSWFLPRARVEASEFDGWPDVASRFREMFAVVDAPAPAIDALVDRWGVRGSSEDARVDRAVRFVQDDVRYLGLEMGPHSHQPHLPAETLERRFGDCKDKTALLVAILRRLGVGAWPALVSTRTGAALDGRLPSLFAFDHAIVAVHLGGAVHFVDPTASEQGGPVRGRRAPPYARALVLDASARELRPIPPASPDAPTIDVAETYSVPRWNAPARLEVVTTYRDEDADDMRQSQARSTRAEMGERYRRFYAREHEGIKPLVAPRVEDDRERNVLVVREAYEIPALWKDGEHEFRAWFIEAQLVTPRVRERSAPLALSHPDHVRQSLRIVLPGPPDVAPLHRVVKSAAFSVDASWRVHGNEARLEYTYRSLRGDVAPKDVPEFVAGVERAADLVVCRVPSRPSPGGREPGEADGWTALGVVGIGAIALLSWGARAGASRWKARRRRRAFAARARTTAGGSPETALSAPDAESIARQGWDGACACRGPWRETERTSVVYDGRPMVVATRRCTLCAAEATVYYRIGA